MQVKVGGFLTYRDISEKIGRYHTALISLEGSDVAGISIKTCTGHVSGTLFTEKLFIVQTDTGRADVPKATAGGRCEISTDAVSIKISME